MKERRPSIEPVFLFPPTFDTDGVQSTSGIGVDGKEYPDPLPTSPPVGYSPPSTLESLIESVLQRRDFLSMVQRADFETPEEADDFDVDEDEDSRFPETIYEKYFEAKSKRAAQQAARQVEASQTPSGGSSSVSSSSVSSVETRTDVSGSATAPGRTPGSNATAAESGTAPGLSRSIDSRSESK